MSYGLGNQDSGSGWDDFPDERGGGMSGIGAMGGLVYVPDLAPVGTGPTYFPRDVSEDVRALIYLGYTSYAFDDFPRSTGTQAGDMAGELGAWDADFRNAIAHFQRDKGLTADSWVGPNTRQALLRAVVAKNAGEAPPILPTDPPRVLPNIPVPTPRDPIPTPRLDPIPGLPPPPGIPAPQPGPVQPAAAKAADHTVLYVGIGLGLVVLGVGAWALTD